MKKLNIFIILLLIAQLAFSQIDTLNYPRIAYPGELVKDTCVEFTIKQAQQAAIDGINADLYKEELDSTNIIVIEYKKLTKQQMYEIRQLGFDRNIRDDIITGFKTESGKYKTWWEDSEAKLHLTKTVDKVVYPILGGGILATILYITLSSVIHK